MSEKRKLKKNCPSSLEFSQKNIDELKPCKTKLSEIEDDIEDTYDSIDYHMDKLEYLENQSRRNNIRIDGILEEEKSRKRIVGHYRGKSQTSSSGEAQP